MDRVAINIDQAALAEVCRRHGVLRLSLFGSVVSGAFSRDSDVDVLVEFASGQTPSLLDLGGLQQELTRVFGHEVDLKTPAFLSRYFRDDVVSRAVLQYAA